MIKQLLGIEQKDADNLIIKAEHFINSGALAMLDLVIEELERVGNDCQDLKSKVMMFRAMRDEIRSDHDSE